MSFRNLRYVNLTRNLVRSINTLYFNSDYLVDIHIEFNKLKEMHRFVFLNQNKTSINHLIIKLGGNYLSRLPRLYGNVSHINMISMADQTGFMATIEDYFFDNSASFKVDNKVNNNFLTVLGLKTYLISFKDRNTTGKCDNRHYFNGL